MKPSLRVSLFFLLILTISFSVNYYQARKKSIDYLMIMNSYSSEEQYQKTKKKIYDIVSDFTKENLYSKDNYSGPYYPYIDYRIDKVRLVEIKGFNHFIFEITFTVRGWRTVESIIYIENGVVYNNHRK